VPTEQISLVLGYRPKGSAATTGSNGGQSIEKIGRPGRTRTDDNTVMSGAF
jgi:hypothetical protein